MYVVVNRLMYSNAFINDGAFPIKVCWDVRDFTQNIWQTPYELCIQSLEFVL